VTDTDRNTPGQAGHDRRPTSAVGPTGLPTHLRILGLLGAGGSATVWRARDTRRGRDLALKLITTEGSHDAGDRLEREVRALARLNDVPGVVAVRECGLTGSGTAWLATDLVAGAPLADLVAEAPIGPAVACGLGRDLAATLAAVHQRGVVHGDITPSNVIVDADGAPRLIDLGLAALGDGSDGAGCTPAWSPPERLRGAPASAAADVYSLAATILTAATGRPPEPHRSHRFDGMPVILSECLAERPSLRPDAGRVAGALRQHLRAGSATRQRRRRWRRRRP
jgi:eukaryotic-like serine/threonine-protein kinase